MEKIEKKYKSIEIWDLEDYDPYKCNNGGCYGFYTLYSRCKDGWTREYGTTADFAYCPICDCFGHICNEDLPVVTDDDVIYHINWAKKYPDMQIEFK